MRPRTLCSLVLLPFLLLTGCDGKKPRKKSGTKPIQTRETIGKTTQEIRRLAPEMALGGKIAPKKITAKDYITLQADAYRTAVGNIAMSHVEHAINLYTAEHGDPPKTYEEFMSGVIKKGQPDGLWLPMLPFYREYAYDEVERKLVVVEYPAMKEQHQREQDERFGRR